LYIKKKHTHTRIHMVPPYPSILSLVIKAYIILYLNEAVKLPAIMRQLSRL